MKVNDDRSMKLFNGDCLEKLKFISDNSVDLILADPPYGITECAWDKVIPFEPLWEELNRVAKQNTAIIIFGVEPFSSQLRMSNLKNYRYDLIYEKLHATGFFLMQINSHYVRMRTFQFFLKSSLLTTHKNLQGTPENVPHDILQLLRFTINL